MDLMHMWAQMGPVAKAIGVILVIMSMISFGVAIERIYTFTQAQKQSKLYAPQVAKHLKDGRLKDAIAISQSKNFRYSHLAKVVLAGLQVIPEDVYEAAKIDGAGHARRAGERGRSGVDATHR